MQTKRILTKCEQHLRFGVGASDTEYYEYECPCGKGTIIEECCKQMSSPKMRKTYCVHTLLLCDWIWFPPLFLAACSIFWLTRTHWLGQWFYLHKSNTAKERDG